MNILVTGGAGFIGTNLVEFLSSLDHNILVLDKLTYAAGGKDYLPIVSNVELIEGDICNKEQIVPLFEQHEFDVVINMAAESHVTRSERDALTFYLTNFSGALNVFNWAMKFGVPRLIHFSTDEVYGSRIEGYFSESDELMAFDAEHKNAYARSKALADQYLHKCSSYPIIIVRPTNQFGPWQNPEKALPRWITSLMIGEKIKVWGQGLQIRDWLFVKECVKAVAFIMENGELDETYNISAMNQPEITNITMAKMLCAAFEYDPNEWIEFVPDPRVGHDFRYAADNAKLQKLGFKPNSNIESQIFETCFWYVRNQDWWKSRKSEAERIYR